jgi:hypothetical protein
VDGGAASRAIAAAVGAALGLVVGYVVASRPVRERAPLAREGPAGASPAREPSAYLGEEGSLFYRQVTTVEPPLLAREAVLLTPLARDEECTEDCPAGLLVVGGANGARRVRRLASSLEPPLAALAASPALPQAFRRALARRIQVHANDGEGGRPLRLLAIGEPRRDYGDQDASVRMMVFDLRDAVFDARRPPTAGGGFLAIGRHERSLGDGRFDLVEGIVEVADRVAGDGTGPASRSPPPPSSPIAPLRPPFRHVAGASSFLGLYLDEAGRLHAYDETLRPTPLDAGRELVDVVRLVLRRA